MVNLDPITIITQEKVLIKLWKQITKGYKITETRERRNVRFRHAFLVSARMNANLSLHAVARILNKDHATVIHAVKQHESNYVYDDVYRTVYNAISDSIISALAEYYVSKSEKSSQQLTNLSVDTQLKTENSNLTRRIKELKNEINVIKEQHQIEVTKLVKQIKIAQDDKKRVEDILSDFKRRYLI
jgi:hypothetical protein